MRESSVSQRVGTLSQPYVFADSRATRTDSGLTRCRHVYTQPVLTSNDDVNRHALTLCNNLVTLYS